MKRYEIMYILNANLDEETRKALMEKLHGVITSNGGTLAEVNEWGLRELAYEINFQSKGYYVVLTIESEDDKGVKEFERQCRIDTTNILRELTVAL